MLPNAAELRWALKGEQPEETQVRKLRRVVEELADSLASLGSSYNYECEEAVHRARVVLQATAPRVPVKD